MTRFTPETHQLIAQEAARRQEEGTLKKYETPLKSAESAFREQARALRKEQFSLNTSLNRLAEQWRAVQESGGDDELEAALTAYMAEEKRIAQWLKLIKSDVAKDLEQLDQRPDRTREMRQQIEAIQRIDPKDKEKWKKLFWGLRRMGGVQGSQKFYDVDEITQLITAVRYGREPISHVTSGGELRLHEIVASFLQADKQPAGEPERADLEQETATQELGIQLRRIHLADPEKWQKLYALLRSAGGLSGSQKFYPAEDLIALIEEARRDPRHNTSRVTGGGVNLNEQVMRFIAMDTSMESGIELQGFHPGDRVVHPFTNKGVTVTSVGTRVADFVPQASQPNGRVREGSYHVLVGSPEFSVLIQNRHFKLAGARDVPPSAEIESPTHIESRTMVVPITSLKKAARRGH